MIKKGFRVAQKSTEVRKTEVILSNVRIAVYLILNS